MQLETILNLLLKVIIKMINSKVIRTSIAINVFVISISSGQNMLKQTVFFDASITIFDKQKLNDYQIFKKHLSENLDKQSLIDAIDILCIDLSNIDTNEMKFSYRDSLYVNYMDSILSYPSYNSIKNQIAFRISNSLNWYREMKDSIQSLDTMSIKRLQNSIEHDFLHKMANPILNKYFFMNSKFLFTYEFIEFMKMRLPKFDNIFYGEGPCQWCEFQEIDAYVNDIGESQLHRGVIDKFHAIKIGEAMHSFSNIPLEIKQQYFVFEFLIESVIKKNEIIYVNYSN